MSWFCIHEHILSGDLYNPPESYCDIGGDDCQNCSHRWSQEDFEGDLADKERDDLF